MQTILKKYYFPLICLLFANSLLGQVGIGTTTPQAQLEIKSSNELAPAPTDGLLIPKVNVFPATNPTIAQQGMLVYLTTPVGVNQPGFYYWNNSPASWLPIKGANGGTLDQAYDFGGAGLGKTITADAGAVLIDGTDGFVSTGILNSGALAPSGAGVIMFWNPRKAAFRSGSVNGTQWNDGNIGLLSAAMGYNSIASGDYSFSFGNSNVASGNYTTAFGTSNTASGVGSTVFGYRSSADGEDSTVFGRNNISSSYGETVLGIGATSYTPSTNGATQFRTANATDRLFVIGNAIDANSNGLVELSEKSDAVVVLKNGLTRLPSTTNAMITAADGKAVITREYLQSNTSGTLDQAYDFGGAGLGKTITADAGAVLINGTDGFVSTGTFGSGAIASSGAGVKMFWNPRKGAFRAGNSFNSWNDTNIGNYSFAGGNNTWAIGQSSVAFGAGSSAIGNVSAAFGLNTIASGFYSMAFGGGVNANGDFSTAFGGESIASGDFSTAFGINSTASGRLSTAFGQDTTASGRLSTASGMENTASSFGETVLGIGATTYTPTTNGVVRFRVFNSSDRLFVIGNAIDINGNDELEESERRDAMVVLKNGNAGFGTSTPKENLVVSGPAGQTVMRIANTSTTSSTSRVALEFFRASNALADWRIFTSGASLLFGRSVDDFSTVDNLYEFDDNYFAPATDNTQSLGRSGVRWSLVYASNGFINTSDIRQKKNIQNLNYGLTDLMKLRPVSFEWKKDDGSGTKLGLIAQELQQVIPEVVRDWDWEEDEQGNRKKEEAPIMGVFYSDLIPVLIKSIQEQQTQIEELKAKIEKLEKN